MSDLLKLLTLLQPTPENNDTMPEALLRRFLPELRVQLGAEKLSLWRKTSEGILLWARDGDQGVVISPATGADGDVYEATLASGIAYRDETAHRLLLPIQIGGVSKALLEAHFTDSLPSPEHVGLFSHALYMLGITLDQHILQQRQQEETATITILQEVTAIAGISNIAEDEGDFLQRVVVILHRSTGVDHTGITIVEGNGEKAIVKAEAPVTGAVGLEVDVTGAEFARMRRDQHPIIVHDTQASDILTPHTRQVLKSLGIAHLMIIPLFNTDAELIGTIGFDLYNADSRFTAAIQTLAITMGAQVATGLQKMRLLKDTRRQAEQMQLVNQFGQTLQARQNAGEILEQAQVYTRKIIQFDYLAFVRYENGRFWRMPYFADGANHPSSRQTALSDVENERLQATLASGEILVVQDFAYHVPPVEYPLSEHYRSLILLPVSAQGQNIGVVEIASREAYSYRIGDIASLEQMTSQFGGALLNAQAYAQSQRTAHNRAVTNDIAIQLQQQSDVSGMLDITVRELGKALKAKRGRIRLGVGGRDER